MKEESKLIRTQAKRSSNREHSVPLYLTSSFIFDDAEQGRAIFADEQEGNIYSRYSNPNTTEFIDKVCELEGAEAGLAFASGMAGVFASFAGLLKSGDHIVAFRSIFGSTHQLLTTLFPRWGITSTYVDAAKPEDLEKAIQPNTKMVFLETPSNPGLELVDLEWLCKIKEKHPQIIINVEDNGKGFDSTKTYSSDGFGLTQIKARVKNLKGKITINSKLNAGTLVYIKLHIPH